VSSRDASKERATGGEVAEALRRRARAADLQQAFSFIEDPPSTIRNKLHGKGDHNRTVAIDDGAVAVLQLWLAERARLGMNGRQKLFCTLGGGPLSANQVRQMVKRRAAKAEITKTVHPHALRHTHAAELVAEGAPVNAIQKQLGHVSLATTDIYLRHITPADVIAMGRKREWEPGD
jgi:site-specific recombinase XerD